MAPYCTPYPATSPCEGLDAPSHSNPYLPTEPIALPLDNVGPFAWPPVPLPATPRVELEGVRHDDELTLRAADVAEPVPALLLAVAVAGALVRLRRAVAPLLLLVTLVGQAHAQTPAPAPAAPPAATSPPTPTPPPAPQLSEVQRLRYDNLSLRFALLETQRAALAQQLADLSAAVTAAHPGYRLDPGTGQLVPVPPAATKEPRP